MSYSPVNTDAYTNAFSGAVAGMAISGWIVDPTAADYSDVVTIAGAFAQAFDLVWNNATTLNWLQIQSIQSVCQEQFTGHAPGSLDNAVFAQASNWAVPAAACAALVLEGDAFVSSEGITPNTPGGGSVIPLTQAFWVDPGRIGSTEDGSIAEPFLTPQGAIDALLLANIQSFTLLLAPGDYSAFDIEVLGPEAGGPQGCVVIEGMSGSSPLTTTGTPMVTLNDITVVDGSESGTLASKELRNLRCANLHAFGNIILRNVYPVASDILITANVVITEDDLYQMRQFGSNTPSTGIKAINTGRGVTFAVPALTGTFADVTVDVSGSPAFVDLRAGDAVVVTTTTRLADVGIVDAFCDTPGLLTLRFFGTTAGGNVVVNFSIVPMSC